jgi:hypothetical protein
VKIELSNEMEKAQGEHVMKKKPKESPDNRP